MIHSFSIYQLAWLNKFKEIVAIAGIAVSPSFIICLSLLGFSTAFFSTEGMIHWLQIHFAVGMDPHTFPNLFVIDAVCALLTGSLPFFYVFFKLQRKRQQLALCMISAVQNFIGIYNDKLILAELISKASRTMPQEIKGEWEFLEMAIRSRSMKESLYTFARRINNVWAEDWADIMLVKGEFGNDIINSLHKLVREMQTSKSNEEKRQAVISIYRMGTIFMVFAAFLIIGFNIYADGNNYKYYFVEAKGKTIVVTSLFILFGSLIAVVLSGRKRI
jgi:H+/Cl- antiporter ClcA